MNVSSINSSNSASDIAANNPWQKRMQDFKSLQSALASGDLSGAKQAFNGLQSNQTKAGQGFNATATNTPNSPISNDYQALQSALSSGDLSGAQKAFASLKQDIQSVKGSHGHHHHHKAGASGSSPAPAPTSTTNTTSSSTLDILA